MTMANKSETAKKIDVEYVAQLARLSLSAGEKELFQKQLDKIIGYVNDIARVDVEKVQPLASTSDNQNVFRGDEPRPGLEREVVLKNAPAHDNQQFLVPRIV